MTIAVGIVCAIDEEFSALCRHISIDKRTTLAGKALAIGTKSDATIVIIKSGMGHINSAAATTLLITMFQPSALLFSGIAGSLNPELNIGDVLIGEQTFQAEAITHEQLRSTWTLPELIKPACPELVRLAYGITDTPYPIKKGVIVSSDLFPAPENFQSLFKEKNAQAIDMETAAFYQISNAFNVPCLCVRSFSNPVTNSQREDLDSKHIARSASNCSDFCFRIIDKLTHNKAPEQQESEANILIKKLALQPHPEGGYYRRTYQSDDSININTTQDKDKTRLAASAIYYLLKSNEYSAWHKLKSDETWFHHKGSTLTIHMINTNTGEYSKVLLGSDISDHCYLQYTVKKNTWFAVSVNAAKTYALTSCYVCPGFDFKDFELAQSKALIAKFPQHENLILQYAKQ